MICGLTVTLRPATEDDRRDVYSWLATSDVTASMMGPPKYPDVPIPTWDDFSADYGPHFFDGSRRNIARSFIIESDGKSVGHINYDGLATKLAMAELDIWMRAESFCGLGYGTDALVALMRHLRNHLGVCTFVIRPSLRNQRAVRAYRRAGFSDSNLSSEEQVRIYGQGDFQDTVTLECDASAWQ
jgi:diamine N-acetyltransferase